MVELDELPLKEKGWDGWAYLNDPKPYEPKGLPADNDDDLAF